MTEQNDYADASMQEIFLAALDKTAPAERAAFLDAVCGVDSERRRKVDALLSNHTDDGFLTEPAVGNVTDSHPSPDWITETPGAVINRYKLLEQIGEGGMGVVYMAEQKEPVRRKVALKIIKLGMDTKQVVARFEAERQALALMDHPNIAKVLDAGATQAGRPYFVMELVRGIHITKFCDENRLSIKERLQLFIPVCRAIQHAHQKGIIHRDIKPSNVLVTLSEGVPHPMVIDFGVAKATEQRLTEKTLYTRFGHMVGTPAYMSPEQAEMSIHDVDTRSDVYSLGVLLYELLTGTTPFPEERLRSAAYAEIQRIIKEEEPLRPSTALSQMDAQRRAVSAKRSAESATLIHTFKGDLDCIVLKALDKDRNRRYETANGLAMDVSRHLNDETIVARQPTVLYRFQKAWRRNKITYTAAAMVMASSIIGGSLSLWQARVANTARKTAEAATQRESELRKQAEESERQQRLLTYASDMKVAQRYLRENNLAKVDELLNRYEPKPGEKHDLRGVEWHHLRQVSSGDELHTFPHETMVRSISLSADGTRLVSNTMSGKVRLFDLESRTQLWSEGGGFMSYGAQDGSVALSPDGRLLAADQQGTLMIWNVTRGALGEVIHQQPRVVAPLSFSPDSRYLAAATEEGLHLWNTTDWTSRKLPGESLTTHASQFRSLAFTPDGTRLVFSPSRFTSKLIVYDLLENTTPLELTGLEHPCVIATDGRRVVAGSWSGNVCVWDLASQKVIQQFTAHQSIVLGMALSPDGTTLATGGNDHAIRLWDTETFEDLGSLNGHRSQIWNLRFSVDGRYLASASVDHSVKLWKWKPEDRRNPPPSTPKHPTVAKIFRSPLPAKGSSTDSRSSEKRPPTVHSVAPGDSIPAAISAAVAGDHIALAAGWHPVTEIIVIDKPLTLSGAPSGEDPTLLKGSEDLPFVIQVATEPESSSEMKDLQIEAPASGIQHLSGSMTLQDCRIVLGSALDFSSAISLEGMGSDATPTDQVTVNECYLLTKYVGDTPEGGTPPDVDVILAKSGSRYAGITVTDCDIINEVPNAISNGIETRSTTAHLDFHDNRIHTQGMAIVMPNHVGIIEVRGNTIRSGRIGIATASEGSERSYIAGNNITIEHQGLLVYPVVLNDFIASRPSACIVIGSASTGVTAGWFQKEVIGRGVNFAVERNVLTGNPRHGISLTDSPEPENFGPPTPNRSHDNLFYGNDFTQLTAEWDVALGALTFDNLFIDNVGVKSVFKEAGETDRNSITLARTSNPRYVLDEITSPALKGNLMGDPATRSLWVWLPPSYGNSPATRYPTIYLLHGFTGDHNQFKSGPMLKLNVSEMASGLIAEGEMEEAIIVMPDASNAYGGSFYARNEVIGDYRTYLARDLVNYIDKNYRTIPDRNHRSIAGNSMGANGALSLAMEFPTLFGAVAAMSPSAEYGAPPTPLDSFLAANPTTLEEPTLVRSREQLRSLLSGNVLVNLLYGRAAAFSPNPNNPPYYVDLPLKYPERSTVPEVWTKWLENDLVSEIERNGQNLENTDIFIDVGVGPVTIMKEGHDIEHLRDALDRAGLNYTFRESPGDHLSHLRERTTEALKFLSNPESFPLNRGL